MRITTFEFIRKPVQEFCDDCGIDCGAHDNDMTFPRKDGIANVMVSGSVTTASGIRELNLSQSDPMKCSFEEEGS
jgi:hypothetical protein